MIEARFEAVEQRMDLLTEAIWPDAANSARVEGFIEALFDYLEDNETAQRARRLFRFHMGALAGPDGIHGEEILWTRILAEAFEAAEEVACVHE